MACTLRMQDLPAFPHTYCLMYRRMYRTRCICTAVPQEDGLYLLMQELQRGLEEPGRRRGAATIIALFCRQSKLDFQEHVPALITVRGWSGVVVEGVCALVEDNSCVPAGRLQLDFALCSMAALCPLAQLPQACWLLYKIEFHAAPDPNQSFGF